MTIKTRLAKLEARKPAQDIKSPYTDEQHARSMETLAEALGNILGLAAADVAKHLPAALAELGGG